AMNWELWNAYTDALVEYRTATTALAPSVLGGTLQDRIRRIRELCNPEMSKHNSLMGFIGVPTTRDGNIIKESEMQEFLVALTAASIVDGIDYLALADTRSGFIDEPHLNGTHDRVNTVITSFNGVRDGFADSLLNGAVKEAVKADVASVVGVTMDEAEFESRYEEMKETLAASTLEISNTVTSLVDSRLTAVDTYCVTRKGSTNAKDREYYKDLEADQWWYNCGSDKVGYRIDGDLLECRILGWMSYDYEYEGDVYWDAALYTKQTWSAIGRVNIETAVDTYTEPVHCGGNNGDGFLFYPGKPYGIEGPVSSVRIHSIRDGREDYELFYDLEQRYEAQGYSPRAVLTKIFDGLYQDLDLIDNPSSVFAAARETVIDMLLLADKGVYITDYEEVGATAKTRIERLGETTIGKINGQTQANKTVYEVQTALTGANNALSIECSDGTAFTMALGGKTETLQTFTKTTQMTGDNVALAIGEADGVQGVSVTLLETAQAYDLNVVEIPLAASDITKNDTSFTVRIYNPDTRKAYVSAYMSGSGGVAYAGDCVLYHGWNSFKVKRLNGILWDNVKKLQSLRLEFSLRDGESVAEQQPLLIASLAVER
ncbi:MAG: DUF4091 domain-containing protein, partial [Clostridia bacterium]|nr:DUF4091 domain-containing protein [Clostridia bacterium]